ncbi:MAG: AI-2E family transporter [Candidatus Nephthysia bennettiae]|uniref:AI-2E family transporter n=1 Tax=Candidatus Nephthysia bennettiae TaxID=3127016 RepID=A0A934K9X7_9BACT|nr:AI-2E family transporter [Candidatus Dormibacteraeota bacterium]MBJ7611883.1 AI-2E family transporter [Candidatus Dormibacteraeota bacterium]PZR88989.1 MAG: AI-2E family transporter [Candidatus Dormibacteraeota bacterium]
MTAANPAARSTLRDAGRNDSRWSTTLLLPLSILAWAAVIIVIGWLLGHVTKAILILVLSAIIAFALTPLVSLFSRWMPRSLAVALAYLIGFAVVFGLLGLVVITAASQITALVGHLPDYGNRADQLQPQLLRVLSPLGISAAQIDQLRGSAIGYLQGFGTRAASDALGVVQTVLGTVIDAVLVLILSVYITANGPRIWRWLSDQAPRGQRRRVHLGVAIVNQVVGGYIRGTLTLATLVGVLVGAGMGVLQVRYAVLLGVLAFFMEFIPIIGVLISGAVCVVIALFQGWPLALIVLAYFVVVHVIEGDVLGPRIMGSAVGIHPAVALIALVAGTELFGIWGALFGAPIAGLIQATLTAAWREVREARVQEVAEEAVRQEERKPAALSRTLPGPEASG